MTLREQLWLDPDWNCPACKWNNSAYRTKCRNPECRKHVDDLFPGEGKLIGCYVAVEPRCDHEGCVILLVDTTPHHKCYGEFYGKCTNCGKLGPSCKTAYDARRKFKEQTLKEFQLLENPILELHAKNTVSVGLPNITAKPCTYRTTCSTADMPWPWDRLGETPDLRKAKSVTTTQLMPIAEAIQKYVLPTLTEQYDGLGLAHLNSTHKQQEALVATVPNPKPYFIVVSSEGHAAIPIQHPTQQVAQTEADRLTKIKPGVTFTVFEAKSSVNTPKVETVKTVYETPSPLPPSSRYDYYFSPFGGKL